MNEVQIIREGFNLEKLKQQWFDEELFFGDVEVKSHMYLQSPYAHLSFEERQEFLNGIRKEYISAASEYSRTQSPVISPKLEKLTFKIIDDTMNYLLFLIDESQDEVKLAGHFREADIVSNAFGLQSVSDIMDNGRDTCECLEDLIQGATYKVLVPFMEIEKYYNMFCEAKSRYDREKADKDIHLYI